MKEFKVNEYITLKLEQGKTIIYIQNHRFMICKRLLLHIPEDSMFKYDKIDSIDEATEVYKKNLMDGKVFEGLHDTKTLNVNFNITPEEEFWGHCSNIQVWAENNYNTRILHSNLAFPLLKRLTEEGDQKAYPIFKAEIIKRISEGNSQVVCFLLNENYLSYLSQKQTKSLLTNLFKINDKLSIDKFGKSKILDIISTSFQEEVLDILIQHE